MHCKSMYFFSVSSTGTPYHLMDFKPCDFSQVLCSFYFINAERQLAFNFRPNNTSGHLQHTNHDLLSSMLLVNDSGLKVSTSNRTCSTHISDNSPFKISRKTTDLLLSGNVKFYCIKLQSIHRKDFSRFNSCRRTLFAQ